MSKRKIKIELIFCYLIIILYIVGANALTFDLYKRVPVKASEIVSAFFVIRHFLRYKKISFYKYEKYILGWFIIAMLISAYISRKFNFGLIEFIYGISYSLRIILIIFTANIITFYFKKNKIDKNKVIVFLLNLYIVVCILGYIQLIFFPIALDYYNIFYSLGVYWANPDPHINRLLSTYFDPNYLASCLVIPFTIALNKWIEGKENKYLIYLIIYGITVVLTVSRSGILGICLVTMFSFLRRKFTRKNAMRNILILLLFIIAMIFLAVFDVRIIQRVINSSSDKSTFARFSSWESGYEIIKDNLFFGIGYNMIGSYRQHVLHQNVSLSSGYGNYSSIILILMSSGIIGCFYAAIALIKTLFFDKKFIAKNHDKSIIIKIIGASLIICNFNNLLFYILWIFPVILITDIYLYENE